ncbi:hypothetical protein SAMN05443634_106207 [Chishuiella changwenlii]|uniref:Uncharacterized protein n=1 Tax=Chishuiella changwenlii TaxID=1434701 RepID=A0A1M6YE93_9FLAO|nr:hypothetical protein [Chishuiella changwenlii]GGE97569.1 hypothetical protein GCM10010984_13930 [Chishuiella changwenlii]SHL16400.1 hypothetical protein SAMN05443634_106207 [Chishuiella changwenlii]
MKKSLTFRILLPSIFFTCYSVSAQVGIGTTTPRGALDINNPTTFNMPLVLPANVSVNNMINPQGGAVVPGSIMYDSTLDCIRLYKQNTGNGSPGWSPCLGLGDSTTRSVESIVCNQPKNTGVLAENIEVSEATFTINYIKGNGSSYPKEIVNSTGVTGLTATRVEGEFNNGDGYITYIIKGTPNSKGIAVFPITIGGISCNVSRSVEALVAFGTACGDNEVVAPNLTSDPILPYLTTTLAAYKNASVGSTVFITETEFLNIQASSGVSRVASQTLNGTSTFDKPYSEVALTNPATSGKNYFAFAFTGVPQTIHFKIVRMTNYTSLWRSPNIVIPSAGKHYIVFKGSAIRIEGVTSNLGLYRTTSMGSGISSLANSYRYVSGDSECAGAITALGDIEIGISALVK